MLWPNLRACVSQTGLHTDNFVLHVPWHSLN